MKQLESFYIEQFRALRGIRLEGLGRINLLVGRNNSGKSTVLEALACFARPLDGLHWVATANRRFSPMGSTSRVEALKWLFPQDSSSNPNVLFENGRIVLKGEGESPIGRVEGKYQELIGVPSASPEDEDTQISRESSLSSDDTQGKVRGAKLSLSVILRDGGTSHKSMRLWDDRPFFRQVQPPAAAIPMQHMLLNDYRSELGLARRYSEIRELGLYDEALAVLRLIDGEIRDIMVLASRSGRPALYIEHNKTGLTPLSVCGDGLRRSLFIALTLPVVKDGILLVDEIESAIHVSVLEKLFGLLVQACRELNVQLFATTHSLEALDAMLKVALADKASELSTYRLDASRSADRVVRFDEKTLAIVRNDLGQEVR